MSGAVHRLQECGFTPAECARLVALRERVRRRRAGGAAPDSGTEDVLQRRLAFARWLVEHGRLGEFGADVGEQ